MNPETFSDLLDRATEAPPPSMPGAEVVEGRRRLRRRRLGATVAGAVTTLAVVGGVVAVTTGTDPGHAQDPVATAPSADDTGSLLDSCRQGNQSRATTEAIFGSGTPVVKAVVRTDFEIVAALESADGTYWGDCWIHLLSAEFASGMDAYLSDPAIQEQSAGTVGTSYTTGGGCALEHGELPAECDRWFVQWVDRVPADVSAVRFDLEDGTSTTVPAQDGYVVLNVLNPIAGQVTYDPRSGVEVPTVFRSVYYLGPDGAPIAADGNGRGRLDGLPPLSKYPSVRGSAVY